MDDVKNYPVLLPPRGEQERLVGWIESASSSLDEGMKRVRHEIALLREYRTRLIADVVTGKLDVREAAAALPEESDEPEALDDAAGIDAGDVEDMDGDAVLEEDDA